MLISQEFGEYFVRLPLLKSAKIVQGNALRTDWDSIIDLLPWESKTDREKFDYILGNPPFVGAMMMDEQQKYDVALVTNSMKNFGVLDYVSAWYIKAAQYLQKHNTQENTANIKTCAAFVSTNSISQGEQVGILWNELFNRYKIKIHFAHRTFKWGNEARGIAAVHVVIIGFSNFDIGDKLIYEYEDIKGEPHEQRASNINPYLVEGKDLVILSKRDSICNSPYPLYGSKPVDDGNFFFTDNERLEFLQIEPNAEKYIKPFLSAKEYLSSEKRWCLWLKDVLPADLKKLPKVLERLEKEKIVICHSLELIWMNAAIKDAKPDVIRKKGLI